MSPPAKSPNGFLSTKGGSMILPDNCGSNNNSSMTQEMMQILEAQVIQGYRAPGQIHHPPPVEWVKNTLDGSILQDHKGYPVSVNRMLATKPLRAELSTRPGPGGKKLTYISGEGVTRTLNEIFGFDGWNMEIVKTHREECVRDDKGRFHVAYTAQVRLTHTKSGTYKEDVGASDSIDRIMGTAVAHALKGSITDALKRAARHFGEKLGNTLYQGDFSINKAPLTLRDALDQYDKERETTKFGPSTTPTVKTSPVDSKHSYGGDGKRNAVTDKGAPSMPQSMVTEVVKPKETATTNNASVPTTDIRNNARPSLAVAKTPSNNPQLVASKPKPIVSATPKIPSNRETQESLKNRLGPAPNFQLPPPSRQSISSSCNINQSDSASGAMRPPKSAAERLSTGNMFGAGNSFDPNSQKNDSTTRGGGTDLNQFSAYHGSNNNNNNSCVNKENSVQNALAQGNGMHMMRPGTSHGRNNTEPTAMEWSRPQQQQAGGALKRPATTSTTNGGMGTSTKKMNANPYWK